MPHKMAETYPLLVSDDFLSSTDNRRDGRLGQDSGLYAKAKLAIISANPERFSCEKLRWAQIRDQG